MHKTILIIICISCTIHSAIAQTNTFPSSGNVGIGTMNPVTNLEVNGDIKSKTTIYNYYNVVNLALNDKDTWFPVVFFGYGNGGPVKFEIIRTKAHEDGQWYGTLHFAGVFNSDGWGNSSAQFVYKYEEQTAGNPGDLVTYIGQQRHGTHVILMLRGGRHYYIKSNTRIANINSIGDSFTMNPSDINREITVSSTTDINSKPNTSVPVGGTEYIIWRRVSKNTALAASGKVGIGTPSPHGKLEIQGNGARLRIATSSDPSHYYFDIESNHNVNNTVNFYATNGVNILKYIAGTGTLCLQPQIGNLLIGKTTQSNPSYKLDVNGNIRANKVVVNTTGADYVFDSAYQLLSLDSVNNFIKKYKHLPGIPSAAKLKSHGADLGELIRLQLQKIEELTIYIIRKNKQLLAQQATIKQEKQRIDRLEKDLKDQSHLLKSMLKSRSNNKCIN